MMYQHMIDEDIERTKKMLQKMRQYNRQEDIDHYQNQLDSLQRVRKNCPKAHYWRSE